MVCVCAEHVGNAVTRRLVQRKTQKQNCEMANGEIVMEEKKKTSRFWVATDESIAVPKHTNITVYV
jgi:hypothetical protein